MLNLSCPEGGEFLTTGERIKQARLKCGMTQTELADKVGVKFAAIHKYENGLVVNLKRETIDKLSKALDVKPSWLMCMDAEDQPEGKSMELISDEIELVEKYKRLTDINKGRVLQHVDVLLDEQRKEGEN